MNVPFYILSPVLIDVVRFDYGAMNTNELRSAIFGQKVPKYALKVPNI